MWTMYLITFDSHCPPSTPYEYFLHPLNNSFFKNKKTKTKKPHSPILAAHIHMGVSFLLEHGQPNRNILLVAHNYQ